MNTFDNIETPFASHITRGPAPRWQRKQLEEVLTPKRSATPQADRFIPNRAAMNLEAAQFSLSAAAAEEEMLSSPKAEYQRSVQTLLMNDTQSKILSFKGSKAPMPQEDLQSELRVVYTQNKGETAAKKSMRYIPQSSDRVLDAPEMRPDYYLNLVDWSSTNVVSVALGDTVYLWNATSGEINELCRTETAEDYVCSVSWVENGSALAIGYSNSTVQIWDVARQKRVRTLHGHDSRVAALAWNSHILTSGCKNGAIFNHDVRIAEHHVATMLGHTQEVCGLKWSTDGKSLASGGNDNLVNIWNENATKAHTFNQHQGAVKALAWCPWQPNLLATGGGTADRTIRFWNTTTGSCLNTIETKSQVSSLLWNKEHKEIISSHGFSNNSLMIWKYPTMAKVTELTGHTQRVLSMAMSPDGTTVMSAAADETLRFWKCFANDAQSKQKKQAEVGSRQLSATIR